MGLGSTCLRQIDQFAGFRVFRANLYKEMGAGFHVRSAQVEILRLVSVKYRIKLPF
jgi:hypothetical protein